MAVGGSLEPRILFSQLGPFYFQIFYWNLETVEILYKRKLKMQNLLQKFVTNIISGIQCTGSKATPNLANIARHIAA